MRDCDICAPIPAFRAVGMPLADTRGVTNQREPLTFWQEVVRLIVEPINDLMNARWAFPCAVVLAVTLAVLLLFGDDIVGMVGNVSSIEPAQIGPPS
jgi:hypothetical protein